jgi:hypothetical protein
MTSRLLVALLSLAACGLPAETSQPEPPAPPQQPGPERVTLTLETRDGMGRTGYSLAERRLVETGLADLVISSSDCGARGRWVVLVARGGAQLCTADGLCSSELSAGGSDGAFEGEAQLKKGEQTLGTVKLVQYSPTPRDWYEQQPIPPFEVTVELVR